jgi:hypothetical protein
VPDTTRQGNEILSPGGRYKSAPDLAILALIPQPSWLALALFGPLLVATDLVEHESNTGIAHGISGVWGRKPHLAFQVRLIVNR